MQFGTLALWLAASFFLFEFVLYDGCVQRWPTQSACRISLFSCLMSGMSCSFSHDIHLVGNVCNGQNLIVFFKSYCIDKKKNVIFSYWRATIVTTTTNLLLLPLLFQ